MLNFWKAHTSRDEMKFFGLWHRLIITVILYCFCCVLKVWKVTYVRLLHHPCIQYVHVAVNSVRNLWISPNRASLFHRDAQRKVRPGWDHSDVDEIADAVAFYYKYLWALEAHSRDCVFLDIFQVYQRCDNFWSFPLFVQCARMLIAPVL